MKAKVPKIKMPSLSYSSITVWLIGIALSASFIVLLIFYVASPYWYTKALVSDLEQSNIVHLREKIPSQIINNNQADMLVATQAAKRWQGAGATYVQQVWPNVAKAQDPYKLLLLQFNSIPVPSSIERGYHYFPNTFKLTKGSGVHQIEFVWQRQSWRTWQLSKLCFYNPQPFDDTKRCASSSR